MSMNENISLQGSSMTSLGRYKLLRLIGRGGMGEVWLGEDPNLRRQVAIKTLPAHNKSDQEYLQRFVREAQAAASLNHPHIVPVHDYGEQVLSAGDVVTYLVMPYIVGGSLEERIRASRQATGSTAQATITQRTALEYLWQAAQAIDYAHDCGVIHRDIKPANMLLRNSDWLMLADFGLARVLQSPEHLTETGLGFGTPHYMSPEQAQGKAEASSDNYSLAVIAYRLFTGRFPFDADSSYAITIQQLTMPVPSPRQFNNSLPAATEDVLLRALAKQPADRYASAQDFIRDLQRSLGGASDVLLLVPTTPAPPVQQNISMPAPIEQGSTEPQQGSGNQQQAIQQAQVAQPVPAQKGLTRRQILTAGVGGAAALVLIGGVGVWELTHQQQPAPPAEPVVNGPAHILNGHGKAVSSMGWSANNILATAGSNDDNHICLWNVAATDAAKVRISVQDVHGQDLLLAWSPDYGRIAVANYHDDFSMNTVSNEAFTIYNSNTTSSQGITLARGFYRNPVNMKYQDSIHGFAWAPNVGDGGTIVIVQNVAPSISADYKAVINLYSGNDAHQNLLNVTEKFMLQPFGSQVPTSLIDAVSVGSKVKLACCGTDGVYILDMKYQGTKPSLSSPTKLSFNPTNKYDATSASQVAWSTNGQLLAALADTYSKPTSIVTWDTQSNNKRQEFSIPDNINASLSAVTWEGLANGKRLAAGADNGQAFIWDYTGNASKPLLTLNPSANLSGKIHTLSWSRDGKWLAASYDDVSSTVLVWKV